MSGNKHSLLEKIAALLMMLAMGGCIAFLVSSSNDTTAERKANDPCGGQFYGTVPDLRACLQTEIPLILTGEPPR